MRAEDKIRSSIIFYSVLSTQYFLLDINDDTGLFASKSKYSVIRRTLYCPNAEAFHHNGKSGDHL